MERYSHSMRGMAGEQPPPPHVPGLGGGGGSLISVIRLGSHGDAQAISRAASEHRSASSEQ